MHQIFQVVAQNHRHLIQFINRNAQIPSKIHSARVASSRVSPKTATISRGFPKPQQHFFKSNCYAQIPFKTHASIDLQGFAQKNTMSS